MKRQHLIISLIAIFFMCGCVYKTETKVKENLGEVMNINSNPGLLQKLQKNDSVCFGYTTITKSFFGSSETRSELNIAIWKEEVAHPETYLMQRSEEISEILDKELEDISKFENINYTLFVDGVESESMTLPMN